MTEAELFDGTVLEFPDGTDPAVIQRVVKAQTAQRRQAAPATGPQAPPRADAPPSPPVPPKTWGETISGWGDAAMDAAGYGLETGAVGAQGITRGAANIAGLPVEAINALPMLANLLPGEQGVGTLMDGLLAGQNYISGDGSFTVPEGADRSPIGGVDTMNDVVSLFGLIPEIEPEDRFQKAVSRASEEVGAAAIPGGAVVRTANKMGMPAIRALPDLAWKDPTTYPKGLAKMFLEPAAASNKAFLQKEATMATAAGSGAAATNFLTGNDDRENTAVDIAGALGGALAGGVGVATIPRLLDVFSAMTGNAKYASNVVRENVANTLAANSDILAQSADPTDLTKPLNTDPLVEAIQRPSSIESTVPGFKVSTADRSGDFGIAGLEGARAGADNAGRFRTRQFDNTDAVDAQVNKSAPTQPSSAFPAEMEAERARKLADAELMATISGQDADAAVRPLVPQTSRPERGGAIREGIETGRESARDRTRQAYGQAEADISQVPTDPVALRTAIDEAVSTLTETRRGLLPEATIERVRRLGNYDDAPVPTGVLGPDGKPLTRPADPPAPINMEEVTTLRTELQRLQRAALSDPRAERGGRDAAEAIGRVLNAVDGVIDGGLDPAQRAAVGAARTAKMDEVDAFGRPGDPLAAAAGRFEGGQPKMRDDRVASTFTDPQNIDKLFARVPTPDVRKAVKEEILSRGDFSTAAGAQSFKTDYAEQLKRFPGLVDEIEGVVQKRGAAEGSRKAATALDREIGQQGVGVVAKYLRYGQDQAKRAMDMVIGDPDPGAQVNRLLDFVGNDPKAVEGARRAFWDVMETTAKSADVSRTTPNGAAPWLPGKWNTFLDQPGPKAVMERLYRDNPEHLENIRKVASELRGVAQQSSGVRALNPSGSTLMNRGSNMTLAEVQAKGYEVMRGRVNPLYMATYLAGRLANRAVSKQAEKAYGMLLDRALLDPDTAALLLKENNPANRAALRRSAKGWMGNEAANALSNDLGSDDLDPVVDAVKGGK